jgi:hypothetical protein
MIDERHKVLALALVEGGVALGRLGDMIPVDYWERLRDEDLIGSWSSGLRDRGLPASAFLTDKGEAWLRAALV